MTCKCDLFATTGLNFIVHEALISHYPVTDVSLMIKPIGSSRLFCKYRTSLKMQYNGALKAVNKSVLITYIALILEIILIQERILQKRFDSRLFTKHTTLSKLINY